MQKLSNGIVLANSKVSKNLAVAKNSNFIPSLFNLASIKGARGRFVPELGLMIMAIGLSKESLRA
jgi:hypothetical protein